MGLVKFTKAKKRNNSDRALRLRDARAESLLDHFDATADSTEASQNVCCASRPENQFLAIAGFKGLSGCFKSAEL